MECLCASNDRDDVETEVPRAREEDINLLIEALEIQIARPLLSEGKVEMLCNAMDLLTTVRVAIASVTACCPTDS